MSEQNNPVICFSLDGESQKPYLFQGLGVQWDPYQVHPVTENEWLEIVKRVDYMRPAFVRVMIYATTYCCGLDEHGNPVYQFDSPDMMALLRELDYLESRNIEVILGEWEAPGRFGKSFAGIEVGHPTWAKMIGKLLSFLLNEKKYSCIHYFNFINEANAEWSNCADWEKWKRGIQLLHKELENRGLSDKIGITGPDSVWDEGNSWLKNIVSDEIVHEEIALYDVHMYPTIDEIRSGDVERNVAQQREIASDKFFYMTEVGMVTGKTMGDSQPAVKEYRYGIIMADIASQVINGGLNGLAIWDLDDAMHDQENGFPKTDIRSLKQWGFFNSVAARVFEQPEEERLRPHFFPWSLMSRFFRRGSHVLEVGSQRGIRVAAMVDDEGKLTVMLVNHGDQEVSVRMVLYHFQKKTQFIRYLYQEPERKTDEEGFPLPDGYACFPDNELAIDLPRMSVIFLSQFE